MNNADYIAAKERLNEAKAAARGAQLDADSAAELCQYREKKYVEACRLVRDRERELEALRTGIPGKWQLWKVF